MSEQMDEDTVAVLVSIARLIADVATGEAGPTSIVLDSFSGEGSGSARGVKVTVEPYVEESK